MSEAPKRIWADGDYTWAAGSWFLVKGHDDVEYIRADLVEAAIKRALEGAAEAVADYPRAAPEYDEWKLYDEQIEHAQRNIHALDPAQFIEEEE